MKKFFINILIVVLICSSIVFAHPGRTDSKGGHHNRSTGEYHYHHGYPAHQHIDGVCPYNYDDKTSSTISSTNSPSTKVSINSKETNDVDWLTIIIAIIYLGLLIIPFIA